MEKKLSNTVEEIYGIILGRKFISEVDAASAFSVAKSIEKYMKNLKPLPSDDEIQLACNNYCSKIVPMAQSVEEITYAFFDGAKYIRSNLQAMHEYDNQKNNNRDAVNWFAEKMEEKLKENDHKGGWYKCEVEWLFKRLKQECDEFENLYNQRLWSMQGRSASENISLRDVSDEAMVKECCDISNFSMMIADKFGKNFGK